jgi:hypothetical protein
MQIREWLVAAVAVLFGLLVVWAAISNQPFAFQLWLPRLLERKFTRNRARVLLGLMGFSLILLGIYLASREV